MTSHRLTPTPQSALDTTLTGYAPLQAGWFRFYFADQRWEWSAEAAEIHGYPATEMNPTNDQVMSHKHPEDYAKIAATLRDARRTQAAISTRHRILDVQGRIREVVVISQRLRDDGGTPVGTYGFFIDVTPSAEQLDETKHEQKLMVDEAIAEISERRDAINQIKGILMLIYRISAETAFSVLRWRSQVTNTKLRVLALQLLDDFVSLDYDETLPPRATFDKILLTAHERIRQPGQPD